MDSLSVIILAYNEIKNLRAAYESTIRSLAVAEIFDFEIIIITSNRPDGSNDGTPAIANQIKKNDQRVIHIHNEYVTIGYKFRQGVSIATKNFITWVPGDNVISEKSLINIFSRLGKTDVVIGYTINKHVRSKTRRFFSWCLTNFSNLIFGLNIKYYSGICIFPRKPLQLIPLSPDNVGFMIESVVHLLKSGASYIEIPQEIKPDSDSAIYNPKNIFNCLVVLFKLFWKIHFIR